MRAAWPDAGRALPEVASTSIFGRRPSRGKSCLGCAVLGEPGSVRPAAQGLRLRREPPSKRFPGILHMPEGLRKDASCGLATPDH